jgi:predicted nuclease of restriction endonuclease-like (RecB) superfamily
MHDNNIQTYNSAVTTIKNAILNAQYEAAKGVNNIQLTLYFSIGRFISQNSRNGKWGTHAIATISQLLKKDMPGLRGYSETSLKRMRSFYEEWAELDPVLNSSIKTDELSPVKTDEIIDLLPFNFPAIDAFPANDFRSIGFTHHSEILTQCKDRKERMFYISVCAREHLTPDGIKNCIKQNLYSKKGQIPNNFLQRLPSGNLAKRAILAFKDQYMLDFINVEELGARDIEEVNETVVEQKIVDNIKKFILKFGKDFLFVGNQYTITVAGHDHRIDLLFYNRDLNCLVAIELKTGAFKQIYLGELNGYLRLLDDYVRKPHENPSIGIVLCKSADKTYVEYMIQDYDKPMGVATFTTATDMPERFRNALPDIEELKKLLSSGDE